MNLVIKGEKFESAKPHVMPGCELSDIRDDDRLVYW